MSIGDPVLAMMLGYTSSDGVSVSESTALTLSAVFRAATLVSGSIASLPLRTLTRESDDRQVRSSSFLDNPGADRYTPFEWADISVLHAVLHGNIYWQHIYNGANALAGLYPIHPLHVRPHWDENRPGGKRFDVSMTSDDGTTRTVEFDASTMTQVMGPSVDKLTGLSVIACARLSIATGLQGDKAANRMFSNGAMISGMITPAGDEEFDENEAKTVKNMVNQKLTGTENAGDIAVINRKLQFSPWQLSAEDAQFLQSRTFQIDEVGRWFGVPPHLLGLTEKATSWGQGIAEQNRGFARYTLTPWTTRIEQRASRLLVPTKTAEFDYSAFVKPSPEDEINLLIAQVNSGLLTLNEARRIRNLPPVQGGDLVRTPPGAIPPTDPNAPQEVSP